MANAYRKQIWLLETLKRHKRLSYAEISEKWRNASINDLSEPLPKRTLKNWIDAIFMTYGIDILCEKGGSYRYYIADSTDEIKKAQQEAFINATMLQVFTYDNTMKGRVLMPNLFNSKKLDIIIQAMNEEKQLRVHQYIDFSDLRKADGKAGPMCRDIIWQVEPYCVYYGLYDWFLIGMCPPKQQIVAFKFSFIIELSIREDCDFTFPKDFNGYAWTKDFAKGEVPMKRNDDIAVLWSDLQVQNRDFF